MVALPRTVQKTTVAPPTLVLLTPSPAAVVSYLPVTLRASAHTVRCQGDAAPAPQFQWRCTSRLGRGIRRGPPNDQQTQMDRTK